MPGAACIILTLKLRPKLNTGGHIGNFKQESYDLVRDFEDQDEEANRAQSMEEQLNEEDLPGLRGYIGPIAFTELKGQLIETICDIPTLKQAALEIIVEGLDTSPFEGHIFSRRLIKDTFPNLVSRLDDLLSRVLTISINDDSSKAYALRREPYSEILAMMLRCKNQLSEVILASGNPVPAIPKWGANGDISKFYLHNEFEMLGILFRSEVENFFATLDEYYDFLKKAVRNSIVSAAQEKMEQLIQPSRNVTRVPEVMKPIETGGPRTSRRESNLYHFTESASTRIIQGRQKAQINTAPTGRLQEVLGNVGNNFGGRTQESSERQSERESQRSGGSARRTRRPEGGPPSDSSDDEDDDLQRPSNQPSHPIPRIPPRNRHTPNIPDSSARGIQEPHFDIKLKYDNIPTWNGDTDVIVHWIAKINNIARLSLIIFKQLGTIIPRRLEGPAEVWYWSLPGTYHDKIEVNWDMMKKAISEYYMNCKCLDKQKARANRACYCEFKYAKETPSEYFIRKSDLLNTVYNMNDSEMILEVMEGAPANWNTVLTMQLYMSVVEFQAAIRFHEDTLMHLDGTVRRERYEYSPRDKDYYQVRTHLVGAHVKLAPPKFPRDDSNVSKRKATPEQKGARPCHHCGSLKHWDPECKYSYEGSRMASANLVTASSNEEDTQREYNDLYFNLEDNEERMEEVNPMLETYHIERKQETKTNQDFHEDILREKPPDALSESFKEPVKPVKFALNRRSQHRLA
ncbi:hypothetical protein CPB84DRAFT_1753487 [Gymnopilus junonius]|uniref:Uncharacterized protein n=1 Tax=Gymnopilus junonius TaxID=109634 RepID=A0A9P5N9Q4_GYMJU|nr:hypothetical protein CPB84DRAFT_1753487 [Gymnopilus junonius]